MGRKYTVDEMPVRKMHARNRHKVPKKTWARWPDISRLVFNQQYEIMVGAQDLFLWPGDKPRTDRRWRTTCWNTAWVAADAVVDALDHILGED